MNFFDKIGKKASEAYKITADKTGKLAKETKINLKISELKVDIENIYEELGKIIYEEYEKGTEFPEEITKICHKVDNTKRKIEALTNDKMELKDKKICINCKQEMDKKDKFCPNCGEKQIEVLEKDDISEDAEMEDDIEKDNPEEVEENEDSKEKEEVILEVEISNDEQSNLEKTVEVESNVDKKENDG